MNNLIPMAKRKYVAAFVGTLSNAPDRLRERMAAVVNSTGVPNQIGKFNDWQGIMKDTKLQLVPRGFGRTSYGNFDIVSHHILIYLHGFKLYYPARAVCYDLLGPRACCVLIGA